jgi:hypothetical protein
MKLLVVVDKLLTGFDAPACTYLYMDKSMQDHGLFQAICRTNRLDGEHGLFQAICRTNRLDGEDKDFGYIVDYKDLFKKVESAIATAWILLLRPPFVGPIASKSGPLFRRWRSGGFLYGCCRAQLVRADRPDRPRMRISFAKRLSRSNGRSGCRSSCADRILWGNLASGNQSSAHA